MGGDCTPAVSAALSFSTVSGGVVGERFVTVLVNRHRCDRREQQCLAIGRSCLDLDRLHAEAALGASAVFNNDRQVESGAQALGQQPGERAKKRRAYTSPSSCVYRLILSKSRRRPAGPSEAWPGRARWHHIETLWNRV
jgi:hypothetical protein